MKPLLIALLLLVALPTPAQAGWKHDRAVAIARIVWEDPCDGNVELRWAPLRNTYNGWHSAPCQISISTDVTYRTFQDFCSVVLFQYGFVAGVWLNDNPRSIMYYGGYKHDERCAKRGRPFLEAHGAL